MKNELKIEKTEIRKTLSFNYSILIVDDDFDDHQFLKIALKEVLPAAYIKSCYDGNEAIEYLSKCEPLPHLVFLDLNMTKTSGRTTVELIRHNQRWNDMPVIILTTSNGFGKEKKELTELGANAFFTKPCSIPALIEIVKTVKTNWLNT